jgi:hypothetical protein
MVSDFLLSTLQLKFRVSRASAAGRSDSAIEGASR